MKEDEPKKHTVSGKKLGLAILLNIFITLAETIGGLISGSIALLSDAAHNFSDVLALIISYFANRLSKRIATEKETFGFRRSEILAAFVNSATLIVIAVIIIVEAVERLLKPEIISPGWIISLAAASIFVNGLSAIFIFKDSRNNLNIRSAYIHLFSDMLTSVAVLLGGIAIKYLGWISIDAVFSLLISAYLIFLSWGIFKSSLRIIMQFTPKDVDVKKIAGEIESIGGVKNIHHVHVWQINEHDLMFEAHLDISEDITIGQFEMILKQVKGLLLRYGIRHSTIQPEYTVDDRKRLIHG